MHQPKKLPDTTVDPTIRLRIATRIHFALLRHYGEDVSVGTLLKGEIDAREALWVCEASGFEDLRALARQFNSAAAPVAVTTHPLNASTPANAKPASSAARGAVPQDLAWSQDTSGFGVTRPSELGALGTPLTQPTRWLKPSSWLRGSSPR
jgi:hypothetical protein